jgi:hypothetical protein
MPRPNQAKPGRPLHVLGEPLAEFLEQFPFASAGSIAEHFGLSKPTIREIIERELGLRRFSRRWVPHSLSDSQKADRMTMAISMLGVLNRQAAFSFSRIVTGDESWFLYLNQSDHMFAAGPDEVIPREKTTIGARKVMVTVFFSGAKLVSLQALPPGARFTQEYFVNTIVPDIVDARREIFQRVRWGDFLVHMDNSM